MSILMCKIVFNLLWWYVVFLFFGDIFFDKRFFSYVMCFNISIDMYFLIIKFIY